MGPKDQCGGALALGFPEAGLKSGSSRSEEPVRPRDVKGGTDDPRQGKESEVRRLRREEDKNNKERESSPPPTEESQLRSNTENTKNENHEREYEIFEFTEDRVSDLNDMIICGVCEEEYEILGEFEEKEEAEPSRGGERAPLVRTRKSPPAPSKEEIERHSLTHMPYRSWCRHCVAGRGRDSPHKGTTHILRHPHVHVDYCFLRDSREDGGAASSSSGEVARRTLPVLVMRDEGSGALAAHAVSRKGDLEGIEQQILRDLEKWGMRGVITWKSDSEPALLDLMKGVARRREAANPQARIIPETSPPGDSKANGRAERGVQALEEMVRVLRSQLEDRLGVILPIFHAATTWMIEHAADLITKYQVGQDGMTPFERLRGRAYRGEVFGFGQCVLRRVTGKVQGGVMEPRWKPAVWLGKRFVTDEHVISLEDGKVVRARGIKPVDTGSSWNWEALKQIQGVPWAPNPEVPDVVLLPRAPEPRGDEEPEGSGDMPRDFRIRANHIEKYGTHPGCPKCRAIFVGDKTKATVNHSVECRKRIKEAMLADPSDSKFVKIAEERQVRWMEQEHSKEEAKKRKHEEKSEEAGPTREEQPRSVPAEVSEPQVPTSSPSRSSSASASKGDEEAEPEPAGSGDIPLPAADGADFSTHDFSTETGASSSGIKRGREGEEDDEEPPHAFRTLEATKKRDRDEPPAEEGSGKRDRTIAEVREIGVDVVEIFSPPRTTKLARACGLEPGWSLDIAHVDEETQRTWDLSDPKTVRLAKQRCRTDRPLCVIASPPCTVFSVLQELGGNSVTKERWEHAVGLVRVAVEFCKMQLKENRLFVYEHPASARSWKLPEVQELAGDERVYKVELDMCAFGMRQDGWLVKKPTSVLTNSRVMAEMLAKKCSGDHWHIHLLSGRAKGAQIYPQRFSEEILKALDVEKKWRMNTPPIYGLTGDDEAETLTTYEDHAQDLMQKYPELVKKSRVEEIEIFDEMNVYTRIPESEVDWTTAKKVGTRWVDVDKTPEAAPTIRSRCVAKEFAHGDPRLDLFAGTPPLSAMKLALSLLASSEGGRNPRRCCGMVLDVKRAFLYGDTPRNIIIDLPDEDPKKLPGLVGRLNKAMYGTRDAPAVWQAEVRKTMKELGLIESAVFPCVYFNPVTGSVCVAHVDDFLIVGERGELDKIYGGLKKKYEMKGEYFGPNPGEAKEVKFLGRTLRWTNEGIEVEGNRRHVEEIVSELGLSKGKPVTTPSSNAETPNEETERPLNNEERANYRSLAAKANYASLDRPDLAYACKEAARNMAAPTEFNLTKLKRIGRYLLHKPVITQRFVWQPRPAELRCFTDSDWAGCVKTRKSTSGGVLMWGHHCLHHWSRTQPTIALSSGEAELGGMTRGLTELLGLVNLTGEYGVNLKASILTDSSAALGTAHRRGAGRMKHLEVQQLRIQSHVADGSVEVVKIPRAVNPADVLTHAVPAEEMQRHLRACGYAASPSTSRTDRGGVSTSTFSMDL